MMGMNLEQEGQRPLTTGQIALYCHVSHRTVLKWVASGKLKAYRTPGKHSRVSINDFVTFLKQYEMPIPAEFQTTVILKKILIVDDDRGIVNSLHRTLALENKYQIDVAYDGFEAGKKFVAFRPHLIVLDIHMPGLDGYHVCANIRRDPGNKNVRILAISGVSDLAEIKKIIDLGADDYLSKPFSNKILKDKVSIMVGGG